MQRDSNHPWSVILQIPVSIEPMLSTLSFNEKYLWKQPLTKNHCKTLVISRPSPTKP